MRLVLDACPLLRRQAADAPPAGRRPPGHATRFEQRGLRLGHEVAELVYRAARLMRRITQLSPFELDRRRVAGSNIEPEATT